MKGVAELHQICQSGNGLCLIVVLLRIVETGLTRGRVGAAFVGMRSPVLDRE
jgi:hypothetical protein